MNSSISRSKILFYAVFFLATIGYTSGALAHTADDCPLTAMETENCQNETAAVVSALNALKDTQAYPSGIDKKVYSYCLSSITSPGSNGLQCRTLTLFYNKDNDTLITDVFIDRFIGIEGRRTVQYNTYVVYNGSGYDRYRDLTRDHGNFKIDLFEATDNNIPVSFVNGFPKFTAHYYGTPLELTYTMTQAVLPVNATVTKTYNMLNAPSEKSLSTAAEWAEFDESEGLAH